MTIILDVKHLGAIWKAVMVRAHVIQLVALHKADQAVKNGKCAIQDALDFYDWAKSDSTAITYTYISIEDYENSEKFLQAVCHNIRRVPGTMKLHAVHSIKPNTVWIRNTACFCKKCFSISFQSATCCNGWK